MGGVDGGYGPEQTAPRPILSKDEVGGGEEKGGGGHRHGEDAPAPDSRW